ncbi:MAG: type IV secretion system DNA-binding domain-containing protein [Candidatus Uhrbacteria bacterium]
MFLTFFEAFVAEEKPLIGLPDITTSPDLLLPTLILVGLVIGGLVYVGLLIARFFLLRQVHGRNGGLELVVLQIAIPKFRRAEEATKETSLEQIRQSIAVAESLFSAIGGMKAQKKFKHWLFGRDDEMAFEIVTKNKMIYFYVAVPKKLQTQIEQQISSVYPDAHIEQMEDYNIFTPTGTVVGMYLTFKRDSGFPIKTYQKLESDPLNAITNALSKIQDNEGVVVQYVVRSARSSWRKKGLSIAKRMQQGTPLDDAVAGRTYGKKKEGFFDFLKSETAKPQQPETYRLSPMEEDAVKGIEQKASKGGMEANIRLIVSTQSPERAEATLAELFTAFSQFSIYQFGNAFGRTIPNSKTRLVRRFIYRTFEERYKIVLNTEEMASLWHLPLPTTETPNIHWMSARRGAAPSEVPGDGPDNLFIGNNFYRGKKTPVYIKKPDRQRHMYLIGKSGTGKSQFLANMIIQDIKKGYGVCVIDPHGDLIDQVAGNIPKERVDDVIVFSPSDVDRPIGLNMLEAKTEDQKDFVCQEMVSIFYKLVTDPSMIGPMFEHQMRNVMLTLMADEENPGTLAEIPRMFTDQEYADEWIAKLKDPMVRNFWEKEMAKTSDFHKSEMLGYLISKVGRFVENGMIRNIIGQSHSSFDLREVMDSQKILLVNLSKGLVGEINANLLGLIIVSKLQMAALGRANMEEHLRKDFYLYIDEFQNFVTNSIATILSEARKYRLCLVMAHQYLNQLVDNGGKSEVRDAVLGNVGTTFVARVGPEDTEILEKLYTPNFSGYDLINSEMYTWYTKMIVDNTAVRPFTMKTVMPPKGNPELRKAIYELSRLKYGRDKVLVEAEIMERANLGAPNAPAADLGQVGESKF